jgi:hypothetical protein
LPNFLLECLERGQVRKATPFLIGEFLLLTNSQFAPGADPLAAIFCNSRSTGKPPPPRALYDTDRANPRRVRRHSPSRFPRWAEVRHRHGSRPLRDPAPPRPPAAGARASTPSERRRTFRPPSTSLPTQSTPPCPAPVVPRQCCSFPRLHRTPRCCSGRVLRAVGSLSLSVFDPPARGAARPLFFFSPPTIVDRDPQSPRIFRQHPRLFATRRPSESSPKRGAAPPRPLGHQRATSSWAWATETPPRKETAPARRDGRSPGPAGPARPPAASLLLTVYSPKYRHLPLRPLPRPPPRHTRFSPLRGRGSLPPRIEKGS